MSSIDLENLGTPAFTIEISHQGLLRFTGLNRRHTQLTGIRIEQIKGYTPHECLPPDIAAHVEARYRKCVASGAVEEYEEELSFPLGRKWWRTTLTPLIDASGRHVGILGTAVDITENKQRELELVDPVTRMCNSRRLVIDLADAMERSVETGRPFSMIVVEVAPAYEASTGTTDNEILCLVADRLRRTVRETDRVARTGDHQFSVLVSAATEGALAVAVDKFRRKLASPVAGGEAEVSIVVGGAVWSAPMQMIDLVNAATADLDASVAKERAT